METGSASTSGEIDPNPDSGTLDNSLTTSDSEFRKCQKLESRIDDVTDSEDASEIQISGHDEKKKAQKVTIRLIRAEK